VAAPVGPTGCERSSSGEGSDEVEHRFLVGAAYGLNEPALRFDGESDYDVVQHAIVASLGYRLSARTSLRLAAGTIFAGEMEGENRRYELGAGYTASLSGAHQWFGRSDELPFLTTTLALGVSSVETREQPRGEEQRMTSTDLRLGLLFGMTFAEVVSPYAVARAFGGPVKWRQNGRERSGSDRRHYALGLGASAALGRVEFLAETTLLGEKSVSVGFGFSL